MLFALMQKFPQEWQDSSRSAPESKLFGADNSKTHAMMQPREFANDESDRRSSDNILLAVNLKCRIRKEKAWKLASGS